MIWLEQTWKMIRNYSSIIDISKLSEFDDSLIEVKWLRMSIEIISNWMLVMRNSAMIDSTLDTIHYTSHHFLLINFTSNNTYLWPLLSCPNFNNSFLIDSNIFRMDSEMTINEWKLFKPLKALIISMNSIIEWKIFEIT